MSSNIKGLVFGCLAGISYGTNPLGALHLYREGLNPDTVLCYRFSWAVLFLAILMLLNRGSGSSVQALFRKFSVNRREVGILAILGILFAACALTLFASFNYMDAGLASTLLFLYPMEVALIMGVFFRERLHLQTGLSIALSLVGILLLYRGGEGGASLSTLGVILVFISSLTYAVYIVVVNRANLAMGSVKLTFYVMVFCLLSLLLYSVTLGSGLPPVPANGAQWGWGIMLGFVPTVLSLVFMAKAVKIVGSTPTAILGALEPLTAVVIGVTVFGEVLTGRLVAGILLILLAVTLLALKKKA